MVVGF